MSRTLQACRHMCPSKRQRSAVRSSKVRSSTRTYPPRTHRRSGTQPPLIARMNPGRQKHPTTHWSVQACGGGLPHTAGQAVPHWENCSPGPQRLPGPPTCAEVKATRSVTSSATGNRKQDLILGYGRHGLDRSLLTASNKTHVASRNIRSARENNLYAVVCISGYL